MKLTETDIYKIIDESRAVAVRLKLSEDKTDEFTNAVSQILNCYRECLGEDKRIQYYVRRHIDRAELRFFVSGEKCDPFEYGDGAKEFRKKKSINSIVPNNDLEISHRFYGSQNIVMIRSARRETTTSGILKQPLFYALVGGIVLGLICAHLPESTNSFIVDEVTKPILDVILALMSGVVGPIVFLSIVKAVSSLDSVDDFTGLGSKILRRFLMSTVYLTLFSGIIGLLFFPIIGEGTVDFDPGTILSIVLEVVPTGFIDPFVKNNLPQIVVLGLGMGTVLLKLGDKVSGIKDLVSQLLSWLVNFLYAVLVVIPLVPFLSLFNIVAKGESWVFLKGWRYIVAAYLGMILCVLAKFIKVSIKCKVSIPVVWKIIKPAILKVFSTGVAVSAIKMKYKLCREELGIDPDFTSLWLPLSHGLFNPSATVTFVLAPFLVAELTGMPVSISFLFVLFILAVEISMTSIGSTAGNTVIFKSLGMSADYVGMFSVYNIVIKNFAAACTSTYRILELIEIACITDNIDPSYLEAAVENA